MEEEESNYTQCQNPMEIDIVIEKIVSYLHRLRDLTSCRQISHTWNFLVSPILQEKMTSKSLIFKAQRQIRDFEDVDGESKPFTGDPTGSQLQDFLKFRQNSPGFITFTNFAFIDICLRHPITQQLLTSYGHLVGALTLDYRTLNQAGPTIQQRTEAFMNLIHEQCPNLQKLKIQGSVDLGPPPFLLAQWQPKDIATKCKIKELTLDYELNQKYVTQHRHFLNGLISCCSSIQKITFGNMTISDHFPSYFLPFRNSCAATLKELNIGENYNSADYVGVNIRGDNLARLLGHSQLQLKCLKVYPAFFTPNLLSKMMESHKSLEEISTHIYPYEVGRQIVFPNCMPELKIFKLLVQSNTCPPTFEPTSFLRQLPSLKQFAFTTESGMTSGWRGLKFLTENSDPQLKLKELRLPFANSDVLEHASKVFPNVKDLVIETGLDGVDGIFSWSELECLHLTVRSGPNPPKNEQRGATLEEILDGHSGKSIRCFKKLRQLTINWNHPSNGNEDYANEYDYYGFLVEPFEMGILTDSSLLNAFSELPKLEYISILEHRISNEAASKFLETGRMRRIEGDGSRFKYQKDYLEEDYIPHKLFLESSNNLL